MTKNTQAGAKTRAILNNFSKFKEKDAEIRQKAKVVFTKAKKRLDEKKLKIVKDKIDKS